MPYGIHRRRVQHLEKTFGRQVKRGEKGIQILAPCQFTYLVEYQKIDPATGQPLYGKDGKPLTERQRENATRFKIATVFDVSQTEGQELPNIGVSELTGEVSDFSGIYDRLTALPPLPVEQDYVPGTAKGYASFMEGRIVIKPGMSQVQTIKTLVLSSTARIFCPRTRRKPGGRRRWRPKAWPMWSASTSVSTPLTTPSAMWPGGAEGGNWQN